VKTFKSLTTKALAPFRNMGLVLFFVGNGIPAGMQLTNGVELKVIFYGVLMTMVPIISGTFLYKFFFKDRLPATTIAGGMTSTPAIGVLAEKHSNISLSKYALAYFGALITNIVLIRIIF
jgi:putative transport protein